MTDSRPTPEEMLERASDEATRSKQGRLRIFFGAVPGVGKTYAMLEAARARKAQGADVVLGWVETHGRRETAALTEGFARIPPRTVAYRGVQLLEFDLDAALARLPALILVDELAHTNAPGSRHARRWQDVVELLDAGVEVWTTLNVQHVESLNDVVAGITGVTVRETVPDSLIDRADEIELVDLPPDDLMQRFAEGKVYVPLLAEQATTHFFKKGNLLALRELALRRTAERVDAQGTEWKREHGIDQVWRTRERILVAIDHRPQSVDLLRAARRMASRLRATWTVLTVEDPAFGRLPEESRERLSEHLVLAQRLGAETLVLQGENVAVEILQAARERSVSRILVGKPRTARWLRVLRGSVLDDLVRDSGPIEVLVTPGESEAPPAAPARPPRSAGWRPYAWLFGPIVLSTTVCLLTQNLFTMVDQAMIFVFGVLVAASRLSRLPALFAAVLSIAAFDFFCVPPTMQFAIADARYGLTFLVMLVVAVTVSSRTVRMREQRDASRERERRNTALFEMSRGFSAELEPMAIATIAVGQVRTSFDCDAIVYVPAGAGLERLAGDATGVLGSEREFAVARWVFENGRTAGFGTDTLPGSQALFVPLRGLQGTVGVLGIADSASGRHVLDDLTPSQLQLLETFAAQTALALERVTLGDEAAEARIAAETERMRSSLLSSVSHDLRTPLASITGSAQVLLEDGGRLTESARRELLETVREEGDRLSRLVANLLDLTRIESGVLAVRREWCPVDDVVHSAIGRIPRELEGRHVAVDLPETVPLVPMDPVLIEQALINLLENACKYSPAGTPIDVHVRVDKTSTVFEVGDRGRGIPNGEERRIFEKFYRAGDDSRAKGAGIGLAVVHAIVVAHGGTITAENRADGGALFRFSLPIEGNPPPEVEDVR